MIPELPLIVRELYFDNNDIRFLDESINDFSKYENLTDFSINGNPKLSGISEKFFAGNKMLKSFRAREHAQCGKIIKIQNS